MATENKIKKDLLYKRFTSTIEIVEAIMQNDNTAKINKFQDDLGEIDYNIGIYLNNGYIDVFYIFDREENLYVTDVRFDWE